MSPRESAVKISNLSFKPHTMVNMTENEGGSHDILSPFRSIRLHMG